MFFLNFTPEENLMFVLNKNIQPIQIDLSRFQELNFQGKKFINVLDEEERFN